MRMKGSLIIVFLTTLLVLCATARKGNKDKKQRKSLPSWRPNSMPFKNLKFLSLTDGKEQKLDCKSQGHPKPNTVWYRNGKKLQNNAKIEAKKFGLTMKNLTTDMAGNYTCIVKNKHGEISWSFIIDVQDEPWPLDFIPPDNMTVYEGTDVVLTCRVLNDPKATVTWQKLDPGKSIITGAEMTIMSQGDDPQILELKNVKKKDAGLYQCTVGNIYGMDQKIASLTVVDMETAPTTSTTTTTTTTITTTPTSSVRRGNKKDKMYPFDNSKFDRNSFGSNSFNQDRYYTTRRPRKNNNRRKNRKDKKNKKNKKDKKDKKNKNRFGNKLTTKRTFPTTTTSTMPTTFFQTTKFNYYETSSFGVNIWTFKDKASGPDFYDNRQNTVGTEFGSETGEPIDSGDRSEMKQDENKNGGSISAWKIYTIIGAVGGVIMLIGLIAITITLCCPKQGDGVYKSTPV